jgi:hypothetical protein
VVPEDEGQERGSPGMEVTGRYRMKWQETVTVHDELGAGKMEYWQRAGGGGGLENKLGGGARSGGGARQSSGGR